EKALQAAEVAAGAAAVLGLGPLHQGEPAVRLHDPAVAPLPVLGLRLAGLLALPLPALLFLVVRFDVHAESVFALAPDLHRGSAAGPRRAPWVAVPVIGARAPSFPGIAGELAVLRNTGCNQRVLGSLVEVAPDRALDLHVIQGGVYIRVAWCILV